MTELDHCPSCGHRIETEDLPNATMGHTRVTSKRVRFYCPHCDISGVIEID